MTTESVFLRHPVNSESKCIFIEGFSIWGSTVINLRPDSRVIQYSKKVVVVQKITTFDDRAPPLEFCPGSTIEKYSLAQHNLCSTTPQLHL